MTNEEAIRNGSFFAKMKTDEIAAFLANPCPPDYKRMFNPECAIPDGGCLICWMNWLNEETNGPEI